LWICVDFKATNSTTPRGSRAKLPPAICLFARRSPVGRVHRAPGIGPGGCRKRDATHLLCEFSVTHIRRCISSPASRCRAPTLNLQLFNLAVWKGWLKGAMFKYGIGIIREDGYQMPGIFFLKERRLRRAFRHREILDEPDYLKLISAA
jgi:hypothetical protein